MFNENKRKIKRTRNLIAVTALTAIVLGVSTYAWFVGMRTVNVSTFDIEIAVTESLELSLDGENWSPTLTFTKDTIGNLAYENNTNSWPEKGLFPVSTIGEMDPEVSRMKLYEKASFTATKGGYRLLASRVHNYDKPAEQDGYVVFDLFIRNHSGTQYINELNELDEEAIYLTVDSEVTVASTGVANTGIENSVRVAFAQIGRVAGTTDDTETITGITCAKDGEGEVGYDESTGVTGICRKATIWEPNDRSHIKHAITWYNTSCVGRKNPTEGDENVGKDVRSDASYDGTCGLVIDGIAYPTYAVKDDIASTDNVNVYDGAEYNGYLKTTKLEANDCFTDSEKLLTGTERPPFMYLAPNSITKVRVYIYIEGQDIDNYDFASIGKRIAINFGFTKQRFTEADIAYGEGENDEDINQGLGPTAGDKTPPVIKLTGANPLQLELDTEGTETFDDPGVTSVTDNVDTALSVEDVEMSGTVNLTVPGIYLRVYKVKDASGNVGVETRTVIVGNPDGEEE
jgi:hypothetical protein